MRIFLPLKIPQPSLCLSQLKIEEERRWRKDTEEKEIFMCELFIMWKILSLIPQNNFFKQSFQINSAFYPFLFHFFLLFISLFPFSLCVCFFFVLNVWCFIKSAHKEEEDERVEKTRKERLSINGAKNIVMGKFFNFPVNILNTTIFLGISAECRIRMMCIECQYFLYFIIKFSRTEIKIYILD